MNVRPDPTFYATAKLAMEGPVEKLAFTLMLSPDGSQPDGLAVVGIDPEVGGELCNGTPAQVAMLLELNERIGATALDTITPGAELARVFGRTLRGVLRGRGHRPWRLPGDADLAPAGAGRLPDPAGEHRAASDRPAGARGACSTASGGA